MKMKYNSEIMNLILFHLREVVTLCSVVGGYQRFGRIYCFRLQGINGDCGNTFLGTLLPTYQLRRLHK
jgi:hypothetical protein